MTNTALTTRTGQNFAVTDVGQFSELRQFTFAAPDAPIKLDGKLFLKEVLNLTSFEISLNSLPSNTSLPFYHKHRLNEEIYIVIQGMVSFKWTVVLFPLVKERSCE